MWWWTSEVLRRAHDLISIGTGGETFKVACKEFPKCFTTNCTLTSILRVFLRPTEYDKLFSLMVWGQDADYDALLANPDSVVDYIRKITNRQDLKFGPVQNLSEWR